MAEFLREVLVERSELSFFGIDTPATPNDAQTGHHWNREIDAEDPRYFAARQKDSGRRCDLEAGMAKLLAARVAWAAADNAVQIHGGNGFALEFPVSRLLCDARILSIFEGAAEIQAQVIARRLLDGSN